MDASEILGGAGCSSDRGLGCGTVRCAADGTGCGACSDSCTALWPDRVFCLDFLAASQIDCGSGFCMLRPKFGRFFLGLDPAILLRFWDRSRVFLGLFRGKGLRSISNRGDFGGDFWDKLCFGDFILSSSSVFFMTFFELGTNRSRAGDSGLRFVFVCFG